ncbi:hypothetical protein IB62_009425 [Xanthomonas euvesicatoria]|nr:hypothetical protein IB62_009425 [Xanthomonas euvesicatoria]
MPPGSHDGRRARTSRVGRCAAFSTSNQQTTGRGSRSSVRITSQLSGAVSSPLAGPLAAWMPPSSPHGRVDGVSRERRGHRALEPPSFESHRASNNATPRAIV